MNIPRIFALGFGAAGLVFFLQGLGFIEGSFMSNTDRWTVIGAGMIITAIVLWVRSKKILADNHEDF
jgi:hypothetical protein